MFYWPFRVIEQIGNTTYKLLLPEGCQLYPTFHVSQLKKHLGRKSIHSHDLPMVNEDGTVKMGPAAILEVGQVPRRNFPVIKSLIQWENLAPKDATWEDADFIKHAFP